VTALWQCPVCETINYGSRSCTACGASLTRRSAAATALHSRLVPRPPPPPGRRTASRTDPPGRSIANRSTKRSGLTTRSASTGCPGRRRHTAPATGSASGALCLTTRLAPAEVLKSRSRVRLLPTLPLLVVLGCRLGAVAPAALTASTTDGTAHCRHVKPEL
jgi:hypothetical protein